jgi:hypothetical protein
VRYQQYVGWAQEKLAAADEDENGPESMAFQTVRQSGDSEATFHATSEGHCGVTSQRVREVRIKNK